MHRMLYYATESKAMANFFLDKDMKAHTVTTLLADYTKWNAA